MKKRRVHNVWRSRNSKGVEFIQAQIERGEQAYLKIIGVAGVPSAEAFLRAFKAGTTLYEADAYDASRSARFEREMFFRHGAGPMEWSPRWPDEIRRRRVT